MIQMLQIAKIVYITLKILWITQIAYIILLSIHYALYIISQICKYNDKKIEYNNAIKFNKQIEMSKCSCCRQTGHKINTCTDARIDEFHKKCKNYAPILHLDYFKGWLYRQDLNLIRALAVRNNAKANISYIYHVEHLASVYYPDDSLCKLIAIPDIVTSLQICDDVEPIECPICYNNIPKNASIQTNCNHSYCSKCIGTHLTTKTNCPMCRETVDNLIINLSDMEQFEKLFHFKFNI